VTFGALAGATLAAADREGPPTYEAGTCTNVYCHGAALHAGGGSTTAPRWDAEPVGGCGTCHGAPPPSHAQAECTSCHKNAPHLDGVLQVGSTCESCHSGSPFANLAGNTLTGTLTVGAHQAHLTGASRLRGPIACTECHRVPTTVGETGHLDSPLPAEVFPLGAGTLARTDGSLPAWDRMTATCTNTYCHGGGTALSADTTPGLLRAPDWTAASGQAFCGACHGIPPSTHASTLTLGDCATCHPSVDAFGNPLFDLAGASRHLDGVIDVF
jgi:predicted CxxxxCH...CXXCH cytochrome family protein